MSDQPKSTLKAALDRARERGTSTPTVSPEEHRRMERVYPENYAVLRGEEDMLRWEVEDLTAELAQRTAEAAAMLAGADLLVRSHDSGDRDGEARGWLALRSALSSSARSALLEEMEGLRLQLALAEIRLKRDAGRLADEVAALVHAGVIDARSPAGDALLDFRDPPQTERSDRLAALAAESADLRARLERAEGKGDHLVAGATRMVSIILHSRLLVPDGDADRLAELKRVLAPLEAAVRAWVPKWGESDAPGEQPRCCAAEVRRAVEAETERAAKVVEERADRAFLPSEPWETIRRELIEAAAAIRSRGGA